MLSRTTEPAEANEQFTGRAQTPWASYTTEKKVWGTMTWVSHAERISLLFTPRGITLSAIVSYAFKPAQPLGRRKKNKQSLHLWLPLAIHFYACITFSGATTAFVVWLCGQLWWQLTLGHLFARLFSSQVRFLISLTDQPHTRLCLHSKRYSPLSFLTSPSPEKSYVTLNTCRTTALGEKARNWGGWALSSQPRGLYYYQNNLSTLKNILQSVINGNGHSNIYHKTSTTRWTTGRGYNANLL